MWCKDYNGRVCRPKNKKRGAWIWFNARNVEKRIKTMQPFVNTADIIPPPCAKPR